MESKYFDDARSLFMTPGWNNFMDELEAAIEACTLDACNSSDQFWEMRGRLSALRQIAGYENGVKAAELMQEEDHA